MGFSFDLAQNQSQPIMKVLLVVALAVAAVVAEPEADANPDAWHGYYGYGYPHRYGYGYGRYYGGYYGYPYRYGYHALGKRSADPGLVIPGQPDDKVGIHPGVTTVAANPVVGNPGYPLAKSYHPHVYAPYFHGHHLIGKREAEATPEADAWY